MVTLSVGKVDTPAISRNTAKNHQARFPTAMKLRGLQIMSAYGGSTPLATWDWTYLSGEIDKAVAVGANALKFGCLSSEVVNGAVSIASWKTKMGQFLDYAATNSLYVYLWVANGFTSATSYSATVSGALDVYVAMAAWLEANYPNTLIGLDMGNEISTQWGKSAAVAHCAALRPALLKVTSLPLSTGIGCGNINGAFADDNGTKSLAPYCDFMDFHCYWGSGNLAPQDVLDWWRTQAYYKPWLVGECGRAADEATPNRNARWVALGELANMRDCFGVFGYTCYDFEPAPHNFGMYRPDGTGPDTDISVPFATWPAHA